MPSVHPHEVLLAQTKKCLQMEDDSEQMVAWQRPALAQCSGPQSGPGASDGRSCSRHQHAARRCALWRHQGTVALSRDRCEYKRARSAGYRPLRNSGTKNGTGSHLVIKPLQQMALNIFIRSQSDFLIPPHSSATPESPRVSQNDFSGHLPLSAP